MFGDQPMKTKKTGLKIPKTKYSVAPHAVYGFWQVRPTPTPQEISDYYAKEFYSARYPRFNNSGLKTQRADRKHNDAHRDDICTSLEEVFGKSLKGLELLDIGCGWGQALLYFQRKGLRCFGFDPVPDAVAYAKRLKLNVVHGSIEQMTAFGDKRFDIVTLFNVLEHLADPVRVLADIRQQLLKPGGVLVVESPNEFNPFQLAGQKVHRLPPWWLAPPAHLNYFTPESLKKLATGIGFRVAAVESSFPMELFLLFGHNYVKDRSIGRTCHEQRTNFELNLKKYGYGQELKKFYRALAEQNLGRQITMYLSRNGS